MSNKTKREAGEAIAEIKQYLRRDEHGRELLDSIERYLVELRREKAKLTDRVSALEAANSALADKVHTRDSEIVTLRDQASLLSARAKQSEMAALAVEQKLKKLEQKHELVIPREFHIGVDKWFHMLKDLKRRMPRLPKVLTTAEFKGQPHNVFNLNDFIQDASYDEFHTLGLFITVLHAGMFQMIGFSTPQCDDSLSMIGQQMHGVDRKRKALHWFRWIRQVYTQPMIIHPEVEESLRYKLPMQTRGMLREALDEQARLDEEAQQSET